MESAVFTYFFCIGAGLSSGIAVVGAISFLIYKKLMSKGEQRHAKQTKQRASI